MRRSCLRPAAYYCVKHAVETTAYRDHRVLEVEAAGFQVIGGLLDNFVPAVVASKDDRHKFKMKSKLFALFPGTYVQQPGVEEVDADLAVEKLTRYQKILALERVDSSR